MKYINKFFINLLNVINNKIYIYFFRPSILKRINKEDLKIILNKKNGDW